MLSFFRSTQLSEEPPKRSRATKSVFRRVPRKSTDGEDLLRFSTISGSHRKMRDLSIAPPAFASAENDISPAPERSSVGQAPENDRLRTTFEGGRIFVTEGVWALGLGAVDQVLSAVRNFDDFSQNDPRDDHEFGRLEIAGEKFVWKIDRDAAGFECGEPTGSPPGTLILTIMLASEY